MTCQQTTRTIGSTTTKFCSTRHSHRHREATPAGKTHSAQTPLITASLQIGGEPNHTYGVRAPLHSSSEREQPEGTPAFKPDKQNQNTLISQQYVYPLVSSRKRDSSPHLPSFWWACLPRFCVGSAFCFVFILVYCIRSGVTDALSFAYTVLLLADLLWRSWSPQEICWISGHCTFSTGHVLSQHSPWC